jgi:MoaA/NifB/PqqE/SkfB family radical SAM enzyme
MCNIWEHPSQPLEELPVEQYKKFPNVKFLNITGGEPFLRKELYDIMDIVKPKCERICISTNGYYTDRIVEMAKRYPDLGFRISLEGLPAANDELRGLKDGFDHGLRSLLTLRRMGIKDIGFGITVSDRNAKDLLELYELAKGLGLEFASACVHNGSYFHKFDNAITKKEEVSEELRKLVRELFKTKKPKNWFRAYFNHGLINYVNGGERLLPCKMGEDIFFCNPFGDIKACNVLEESMGNLKDFDTFDKLWNSEKAKEVKANARKCGRNCWMIGSVSPAIKENKLHVIKWILKNKWNY